MLARLAKSVSFFPSSLSKQMSTRINGTGSPIKLADKTLFGPFIMELTENGLANVLKNKHFTCYKSETGIVEAYSPLLAEKFNPEVVNTLGLMSGGATSYSNKAHIIFYTKMEPRVVNNQYTGDVVGFKTNRLPVELVVSAAKGQATSHNAELLQDLKSKIIRSVETLPTPKQDVYRSSLEEFCSNMLDTFRKLAPGS
ncbi:MAG: hypothetical protein WC627_01265 [Legionella sp.]|jgi:hypothetical protein